MTNHTAVQPERPCHGGPRERIRGAPSNRVKRPVLGLLAGSAILLSISCCGRSEGPAATPTPTPHSGSPTTQTRPGLHADWPAFQGGGALLGQGADIGPPPMRLRWQYKVKPQSRRIAATSAAIVGDHVYVADADGGLHALALSTGQPKWVCKTESRFEAAPLVKAGRVLLGDSAGTFYAFDADDGHELWRFDSGSTIFGPANSTRAGIVFGTEGAMVFCLAMDGKQLWSAAVGKRINSAPASHDDEVYTAGCDAMLRVLDSADGQERRSQNLPALTGGSPAILADRIIVGTDGGHVVCIGRQDLKTIWDYTQIDDEEMVLASPAVALEGDSGTVVIGARDNKVHAVDLATGRRKWAFATRGPVDASPLISGGRVYVGSDDKRLYVLDLKTGAALWKFQAGSAIVTPVAIGGGVVVFGDAGGTVYCLEAE